MRALTWQGTQKVSVETVPDPQIQEPTDAIVRVHPFAANCCGAVREGTSRCIPRGDVVVTR